MKVEADKKGVSVSDLSREERDKITKSTKEAMGSSSNKGNSQTKTSTAGDPVLVSTGSYALEEEDNQIIGSSFTIKRKNLSEEKIIGSMGAGWLSSLDSRIVRGVTKINEGTLEKMRTFVTEILECYQRINTRYEKAAEIAEELYNQIYLPTRAKLNELENMKTKGEELASLNKYSKFRGTPEYFENVGNDNLVIIDENGTPRVYVPAGRGIWVPDEYPEKLYERLESVDGNGAESRAGFVLTVRGGVKKHYDKYGLLTGVTELNGDKVELFRDEEERITRILGPHGNEWKIEYSGDFISRITDPDGTAVQYGYSKDALEWVKDRDGDTVQYSYEEERLKEITKPDRSTIRLTYGYTGQDGRLLVTATTHEEGASEKFEYNPPQKATIHSNHSGVITRYWYDESHRTVREEHSDGRIKTFAYNNLGQLEKETLNGFETLYSYDNRSNITEKSYMDRTQEKWEWSENDQLLKYTDRDGIVTERKYDSQWNCVEVSLGGQVTFRGSYDEKNRLITSRTGDHAEENYVYDSRDFIKSRSITVNGVEIREEREQDAFGRVVKYIDGAGRVWNYQYTANETIETTPTGLVRRYEYNNRKDLVRVVEKDSKSKEEREQRITYDKRHLPVEKTDGAGIVTRYQYREDGEMIKKEQGPWYWEFTYEPGGRMNGFTQGKTGSSQKYTEEYNYTWQGWNEERTARKPLSGTTAYGIDVWGQVTAVTNALGESSSRTLNGAGNPLREQGAAGGFYEYRYDNQGLPYQAGREGERAMQVRYNRDGTMAEKTDRLGNLTRYVYDGRGLLSRELSTLGEQRYYYDGAGRVIRLETLNRNSGAYYTTWAYDEAGSKVTISGGGMYSETLYLNAWCEVIRQVDGEGNERRYEYDGAGKLIKAIDGYGRATGYAWNELGKVTVISYADGTTERYEYDHLGNVTEIKDALGVSWAGEYDEAGRLIKETGRPGINREYKYDALSRVIEVKNGGEVVERYRYSSRGREIVFTDGEGGEFTQRKNAYGELADETNRVGDNQSFGYDSEGRPVTRTAFSLKQTKTEYRDNEGITVTTYSDGTQDIIERDLLGNIVRVTNETGTIRYKYDAGGNLAEQSDSGAGELTRYAYDKAGKRTRMASGNRDVNYRYGKNGELLRVQDNSQRLEVTYEYDIRGRESKRVYGNGVRQETLYDQIGRVILIRETDSRNNLLRAEGYLYDAQGRRSHCVDEEGRITKYEYDGQSRLTIVLYPWTDEKAEADRKEAEEAGLYFTPDKGNGERYSYSGTELAALREVLNKAGSARGNAIASSQLAWRESYTYDRNGNRAGKTTPWGIIKYEYDAENRLVKKGDVTYTNDKNGNVLSENGLRYEARYQYNGQNRMVNSQVTSHVEKSHVVSNYAYDALGRRTITESVTGERLRTLYDGKSFEILREGEAYYDGSLTTRYAPGEAASNSLSNQATGERYRWVGDGASGRTRGTDDDGYTVRSSRYGGRGTTLYGKGEAVAVNYSSTSNSMYLGKDIIGSVRSVTADTGSVENRYEYDAFGHPYKGDLTSGMNLGYTGKPYDSATGLYNYGFRDYKPQAARFTTVDPIRDGNNWFAYVNNDPVNWRDLWGLSGSDAKTGTIPSPTYFTQNQWTDSFGQNFAGNSCAATTILNGISTQYTINTGQAMTLKQGTTAMQAAVTNSGNINSKDANVNNWEGAANNMWGTTGQTGTWTYNENGSYQINAIDKNLDGKPDHFVNNISNGQYRDPSNGNFGNVRDVTLQEDRPTRGFDFNN
jgi:RHS repeat-associated protein